MIHSQYMKITILTLTIFLSCTTQWMKAQTNPALAKSGIPIEMLFPGGKTKALILSYDDGRTDDRKLVKLLNDYNLIGTFHLNSNKLGTTDYLTKAEIKDLFKGHEVSVHSANHPNLTTLSKVDIVYEIAEDRKELERLIGFPVRGMAYPFGNNNDVVIDAISGLGIEYARTVDDTYNFKIPENFLKWHPSVHQFAKAYWEPNNPENDKKELNIFYKLITDFITTKELALLDVWGHSWEYQTRWDEVDKFFKMIANNNDICYTTQIAVVDYINAFRNLKFSVDKSMVTNLSSIAITIKKNGTIYEIKGGSTLTLKD
jgi:peptidoglycan/xylan/chitin deacetylase (PgdA/CDA1 family)